jgi:hypothetical protein
VERDKLVLHIGAEARQLMVYFAFVNQQDSDDDHAHDDEK